MAEKNPADPPAALLPSPPFVDDIDVPGVLQALTIRSPIAKGRLLSIDAPKLPPAYCLIRAADIPGKKELADFAVPILAEERLSYIGEPAALLVGPDRARLEELAAQCKVNFEEEAPETAIFSRRDIRVGDTESAFREAQTIVEGTYTTGIQAHWCSEPAGALAVYEDEGSLRIYTAAQWPFQVRLAVAAALDMPQERVIVENTRLGVHLDGKIWYPALPACQAALGARITGKPVRIVLSRAEDFRYGPKRNGASIRLRSALGDKGQILATEASVTVDLGAQGVFTEEILDRTCLAALGLYRHGAFKIEGAAAAASTPPAGPFAGFGLAQGFFAAERHASRAASVLGQDPLEWRKNNALRGRAVLALGVPVHEHDTAMLDRLLDTAAKMADFKRKWASYEILRRKTVREPESAERGIGIAWAFQGSGFLYDKGGYAVELTLEKDGALEIRSGAVSPDNGRQEIWRKIARETLSVEGGMVRFVSGDTAKAPDSGPASLSRNITVLTKLVERACIAIRKQRFRDPLPITVRRAVHPAKGRNWEDKPVDTSVFAHPGLGAATVEVSIDPVDYGPRIRGVWLAVDGGAVLSEERARRSLRFSIVQALSWASLEQLEYSGGIIPEERLRSYHIPGGGEVPIHIEFLNSTAAPKGIGELAFSCVPAAYIQAVSQAADHPFSRLPLTSRDVWEIKEKQ